MGDGMIELWALPFLLFDLERYLCQVLLFSESTSRCGHTLVDSNNWGPTSCDLLFSILGALGFSLGKFACGTRTAKRMGTPFGLTMFRFNIFVRRLSSGVQASLLSCIESDGIYTVLVF